MREIIIRETVAKQLKKMEADYLVKVEKLFDSIVEDPFTGIGKPKQLKHSNEWSRRIDKKNRLVYIVTEGIIEIVSVIGHYKDH